MQRAEPGGPALEIGLLGPVEVRVSARPLELGRQQQRAIVALLALNANGVVSIDRLIDALWGEHPPASAAVALYGLVSGLRKLLDPDAVGVIVTKPPGYVLAIPSAKIDLGRFEQLVADGRRALADGDVETASQRLGEALALWRGPPLQDLAFLPFAQAETARLEELRLGALEDRIEADLVRGRNGDLVPELVTLVAEHPLRERLRGQLMRALYRAGRQADALATYREGRHVLVDELGLDLSEDLQALERAILRHDPGLTAGMVTGDGEAMRSERAAGRSRARWIAAAAITVGAAVAAAAFVVGGADDRTAVELVGNGVALAEHGKVVAAGPLGAAPSDVAATADSVWVASADAQTVTRIDRDTGDVRETIPTGSAASAVAADEHAVWVASSLDGNIRRIDPRVHRVVDTIAVGGTPVSVALGRGSVWVADKDEQTLLRLDAHTGVVRARIPVGAGPRAVAIGAGAVWVADETRGAVLRVDADRKTVDGRINVGNGPSGIAVGHGSVWVANSLDGTVSRIDPRRDAVVATIAVGDGPRGIAISPDGVWVGNEFDGTLTLIDPRTNGVKRIVQIGGRPSELAATGGRVVVAVRAASSAHRGGTLRVTGGPSRQGLAIDPLGIGAASALTNDGLVAFRHVGGADGTQLVPDLAVAIPTPTDGGRTYTFRLRADIPYSDGRLVRAADFRRTFERLFIVLHETTYYAAIVGAEQCAARPRACDLSRGIVTDDRARTVTFHLREPDPDFLYKLAWPLAFVVPADTPAHLFETHPLPATGPYVVDRVGARRVTLVRNPRFHEWSKAAQPDGYPDRIELTLSASPRAAVRAAERGSTDVPLVHMPRYLQREVQSQYANQTHVNPVAGVTYLFLNTRLPPFDDVRARRAVSYAADRAAGVRVSARFPGGKPTCQIVPPDIPGFRAYCRYTARPDASGFWKGPDLRRARRLVAASGTRGAVVNVWVPYNHVGEGPFAAKLFRSLGYRVRLQRAGRDMVGRGPTGPWLRTQAGLFTWIADYPAASNYIALFFTCGGYFNWSGFCDRGIDARIRRALELQTIDPYLANLLWARLDRDLVDRAPFVPLFTLKSVDFVSRRVGNYQYSLQWGGSVLLDQLWVR